MAYPFRPHKQKESEGKDPMFGGAAAFFGVALMAALMGYSGFAAMFMNIAWILFLFGLVFAALFSIYGHETRQESSEGLHR